MGKLLKALSPISSYAAKKGTTWDDVTDRIEGAMFPAMLDEVEVWLDFHELEIPGAWREPLAELIEKKREALKAEDIGEILRDRYDFE